MGQETSKNWQYSWGDDWRANIEAKAVSDVECSEMLSVNVGFCGYEWMLNSIIKYDKILTASEMKEKESVKTDMV